MPPSDDDRTFSDAMERLGVVPLQEPQSRKATQTRQSNVQSGPTRSAKHKHNASSPARTVQPRAQRVESQALLGNDRGDGQNRSQDRELIDPLRRRVQELECQVGELQEKLARTTEELCADG